MVTAKLYRMFEVKSLKLVNDLFCFLFCLDSLIQSYFKIIIIDCIPHAVEIESF